MPTLDPRIDAYIAKSGEFAQPIMTYLRETVHATCPEVEETIKWGFPHFMYKGMFCSMAAFKAHCALNFWKGTFWIEGGDVKAQEAMGQFGRITTLKDLPPKKILVGYLKKAMQDNDADIKPAPKPKAPPRELVVPHDFTKALKKQAAAFKHFTAFTPGAKREYVDWLEEAKTEATRLRRMEQAVEWIAEGKKRNWKYENC
jgi:uncharacterized protein YdeI (YjbR/CyaY-like superfamily)